MLARRSRPLAEFLFERGKLIASLLPSLFARSRESPASLDAAHVTTRLRSHTPPERDAFHASALASSEYAAVNCASQLGSCTRWEGGAKKFRSAELRADVKHPQGCFRKEGMRRSGFA